eukprot:scaffold96_cov167-Ochromonas_danica.AAC.40
MKNRRRSRSKPKDNSLPKVSVNPVISLATAHEVIRLSAKESKERKHDLLQDLLHSISNYESEWQTHISKEERDSDIYGNMFDNKDVITAEDEEQIDDILEDVEKSIAILLNRKKDIEVIPENMSSNMASLFGQKKEVYNVKYKDVPMSDWRPPQSHGLSNSPKMINNHALNKHGHSPNKPITSHDIERAVLNALQNEAVSPVVEGRGAKVPMDRKPPLKSGLGNSPYKIERLQPASVVVDYDEEEEEESDDEEDDDDLGTGLLDAGLSPDLAILLGLDAEELVTDWRPPSKPGLNNSVPIVSRSVPLADYRAEDEDEDEDEEDDTDYDESYLLNTAMSPDLLRALGLPVANVETDWRPPEKAGLKNSVPIVSNSPQRVKPEEDEEEEEEDDDEDDDDNDGDILDDNGYDKNFVPSGGMSLGLMRALGLDTSNVEVKTDWKPPSHSGLNNSSRTVS